MMLGPGLMEYGVGDKAVEAAESYGCGALRCSGGEVGNCMCCFPVFSAIYHDMKNGMLGVESVKRDLCNGLKSPFGIFGLPFYAFMQ